VFGSIPCCFNIFRTGLAIDLGDAELVKFADDPRQSEARFFSDGEK
jgi:hypothetical protein